MTTWDGGVTAGMGGSDPSQQRKDGVEGLKKSRRDVVKKSRIYT